MAIKFKPALTTNAMPLNFFNFQWLSSDVPRLPSHGIYISQLVRFARCCTSVSDFHSKNLQITSNLFTQGNKYHKLRKTFEKFFGSYSKLLSKFLAQHTNCSFKNESLTWFSVDHLNLQTKEGQRRSEFHLFGLENILTPSTSNVWPSGHR